MADGQCLCDGAEELALLGKSRGRPCERGFVQSYAIERIKAVPRIIETAKANGHEPYAYLCHLFATLPNCSTEAGREALLPYWLDPSSYKANAL